MNNREVLIFLHLIEGVGWSTINKIVKTINPINKIISCDSLEIAMRTGVEYTLAQKISEKLNDSGEIKIFYEIIRKWETEKIKIITFYDSYYSDQLKEISQPPWVLFTLGNLDLLKQPALAIVGTRTPTNYGKLIAKKISENLGNYDIVVVSGMARGIDSVAHSGALANQGKTIAVLGCGIDIIYPKENQKLYKEISQNGLIVSEYLPGMKPKPGFFPQRNRIISGLSLGTIVIEAAMSSGSLITVQYALEQSREVFAVPGPINSKNSFGTNSLIKQGAKLVQDIEDIINEFPYQKFEKSQIDSKKVELSRKELELYSIFECEPLHIDDIYSKCDLDLSVLYELLFILEGKEKVKQIPGGLYLKVN